MNERWCGRGARALTVENTLPVEVALHVGQVGANPLQINLVLDVRHQDERGDNTVTPRALELARDLAVKDVVAAGDQRADTILGHGHEHGAVLDLGETGVDPVGGGGITEVLGVEDEVVHVVPGVGLGLADRHRGARLELVGVTNVAATEAVGASTALTIF